MKIRSVMADGFDKSVAEKMPKMRKQETFVPSDFGTVTQPQGGDGFDITSEIRPLERPVEKMVVFQPPNLEKEQTVDVLRLIEDLHTQLLASSRTRTALEMDLHSYQRTIHQLTQDNQELRSQLEHERNESQKIKALQSESMYLKDENEDALERIQRLQQELRELNETLAKTAQEGSEATNRIQELESQLDQNDLIKIKGKLKEREASHFYEENQKLQYRLEEALAQNVELESKYENLKKSFHEVRESLTLLRDSCKKNYYNLSENPE